MIVPIIKIFFLKLLIYFKELTSQTSCNSTKHATSSHFSLAHRYPHPIFDLSQQSSPRTLPPTTLTHTQPPSLTQQIQKPRHTILTILRIILHSASGRPDLSNNPTFLHCFSQPIEGRQKFIVLKFLMVKVCTDCS